MKLYYMPGACSMSPHIVLREAGFEFELEKVDYPTKKTERGADFNAINPKGYVPTLVLDNGEVLTEGAAIVQYLADQKPELKLAPPWGSPERYKLQEWLSFVGAEIHKSNGLIFPPHIPEETKNVARRALAIRLAYLDKALAGKTYLLGDQFTVADAYCFWALHAANFLKVDLSPFANVRAYMQCVAARPKVQETLKAEGLA
jgi:glutathione S-transferase